MSGSSSTFPDTSMSLRNSRAGRCVAVSRLPLKSWSLVALRPDWSYCLTTRQRRLERPLVLHAVPMNRMRLHELGVPSAGEKHGVHAPEQVVIYPKLLLAVVPPSDRRTVDARE